MEEGQTSTVSSDREELLRDPTAPPRVTHYLPNSFSIIIAKLILVGSAVSIFVVPHFCKDKCAVTGVASACYTQCCLWVAFVILDRVWRSQHYHSRLLGFIQFYRDTRHIRRIPLFLISAGTVLHLVGIALLHEYCKDWDTTECPSGHLLPVHYIQIVASFQDLLCFFTLLVYLMLTRQFHLRHSVPDALREDNFLPPTLAAAAATNIGFREETYVNEIMEQQADMIHYLRQHNEQLGRKVFQLTAQLTELGGTDH